MELTQTFEHWRPVCSKMGLNEAQAFQTLMQAHMVLEQDPVRAIQHLCQHYNITPAQLGGVSGPDQVQLDAMVTSFASEKGDAWPIAESEVIGQLELVLRQQPHLSAQDALAKAWERAAQLTPELAARAREKREAEEAAERKRKADAAKKHASINVKSTSRVVTKPTGKWEDTMREVANRIMG